MTPRIHSTLRALSRPLAPLAAALLAASLCAPLQAQQLIAPTAMVGGFNQGFIMNQFSQWWMSIPAATNPLLDLPGANTALGDQGAYFFLGGSFNGTPVVRNVTVRPDQTLFLNLQVVTAWPDFDEDEATLRNLANHVLGNVNSMTLSVDGAPALLPAGYAALNALRHDAPLFSLNVIPDNLGGWPPGIYPAVTDGYLLAMEGLSAGSHQVRWTVNASPTGPFTGLFTFEQNITYNITAVPEPATVAMLCLGLAVVGAMAMRRRRADQ